MHQNCRFELVTMAQPSTNQWHSSAPTNGTFQQEPAPANGTFQHQTMALSSTNKHFLVLSSTNSYFIVLSSTHNWQFVDVGCCWKVPLVGAEECHWLVPDCVILTNSNPQLQCIFMDGHGQWAARHCMLVGAGKCHKVFVG